MKHHTFPNYPLFFLFFLKFPLCPTSLAHHGFADFFTYKFFVFASRSAAFLISFSFLARYLSRARESLVCNVAFSVAFLRGLRFFFFFRLRRKSMVDWMVDHAIGGERERCGLWI